MLQFRNISINRRQIVAVLVPLMVFLLVRKYRHSETGNRNTVRVLTRRAPVVVRPVVNYTQLEISPLEKCKRHLKDVVDVPLTFPVMRTALAKCLGDDVSDEPDQFRELFTTDRMDHLMCQPVEVREPVMVMQLVALGSFPGSGDTWARHLLEQMTGKLPFLSYHLKWRLIQQNGVTLIKFITHNVI